MEFLLQQRDIWLPMLAEQASLVAMAVPLLLAAMVLGFWLERRISNPTQDTIRSRIADYAAPLLPSLCAVLAALGLLTYTRIAHLADDSVVVLLRLMLAWLAIRFVLLLAGKREAGWLIALVVLPVTLLHLFGLWEMVMEALESLTFRIGKETISVYVILKSITALIILFWLVGRLVALLQSYVNRLAMIHVSHRTLLMKLLQIVLYFLVFMVGLQIIGVDLTALSVFGGALGVGLGFGLQKIASNFISGIILLFEKSIQIDDIIELQDGTTGFIRRTGARFTLMETLEGREILIPNEDFITQRMVSWTHSSKIARVEIPLGVGYDSDLDQVRDIMLKSAKAHPKCLAEPKPLCFVTGFGESSINVVLYFYIADISDGRMEPRSDVIITIWREFKALGIHIPYPQRVMHVIDSRTAGGAA